MLKPLLYVVRLLVVDNIEKFTGILIEEVSIIIDKITGTDKIKKDYAEKNGYDLLVIPYWEFKNIDKILSEKLLSN